MRIKIFIILAYLMDTKGVKMSKKITSFLICAAMMVSFVYANGSIVHAEDLTYENTNQSTDINSDSADVNSTEKNEVITDSDNETEESQEKEDTLVEADKDISSQQSEENQEIQGKETDNSGDDNQNIEYELVENSWRYKDGKLISRLSASSRSVNAWANVNGVFYNDRGEVIEGAVAKGIDVSVHQGNINWTQVKNSDVDFVIIRCGYGSNTPENDDAQWLRNVSECERLGIPYGVYIYSYAMSVEGARSEAEHVLRLLEGHNPTYPIFYDLENEKAPYDQSSLPAKTLGDMAEMFVNTVESAGYETGIYANKNWFTNILTDSRFDNWYRWVAQYNSVCDYAGEYGIWQCTSSGQVPGINGNVDINFEFSNNNWRARGIKTSPGSPQLLNASVNISADIIGDASNLKYKFVWMKNNWAEWGVIQDFSQSDSALWKPEGPGEYTLYMNVNRQDENSITVECSYEIKSWSYSGIKTSVDSPTIVDTDISISAIVGGETDGLKYKFVWMKDNWAEWGVIQDFSVNNNAVWVPGEEGDYTIFVNVQDSEGFTSTQQCDFEIVEKSWAPGDTVVNVSNIEAGQSVAITQNIVKVTADKTNLQYKFVWMKDNWSEWGVIQGLSDSNSTNWIPQSVGECLIYVDIKDNLGNTETVTKKVNVTQGAWEFVDILPDNTSPYEAGEQIDLNAQVTGNSYGLQYKFVWMKDNWAEWGVIQDFSSANTAVWSPDKEGNYYIYINVKDFQGKVVTKDEEYEVINYIWQPGELLLSSSEIEAGQKAKLTQTVKQIDENGVQLRYKFVWMKDNWSEWGVIQDFSESNSVIWQPEKAGNYKIYVDIKDDRGNAETIVHDCSVVQGNWQFYKIATDNGIPYIVNDELNLEAVIRGNAYGLQYKYVWMKDNWKEWGVIRDFSTVNTVNWRPENQGEYFVYLNIKDASGSTSTFIQTFNVESPDDFYIKLSSADTTVGGAIDISVIAEDTDSNTEYKYVWMKDNWKEWGVIRDYSGASEITWIPENQGEYTIYVDLKRTGESTVTENISVSVEDWIFNSVQLNPTDEGSIEIVPQVFGNMNGFQYKYVWMKDNWAEWGLISDFSEHSSMIWEPEEAGRYEIYVNVKDGNGITITLQAEYLFG